MTHPALGGAHYVCIQSNAFLLMTQWSMEGWSTSAYQSRLHCVWGAGLAALKHRFVTFFTDLGEILWRKFFLVLSLFGLRLFSVNSLVFSFPDGQMALGYL